MKITIPCRMADDFPGDTQDGLPIAWEPLPELPLDQRWVEVTPFGSDKRTFMDVPDMRRTFDVAGETLP